MTAARAYSAIVTRYQAGAFGLTTFYPGRNYSPTAGEAHARLSFIPSGNDGASLGPRGVDRLSGIAQIDLMYPEGTGVGDAVEKADAVASYFLRGQAQVYQGRYTVFTGATILAPRNENGWLRVPVSIGWYTHQTRAVITDGNYSWDADTAEITGAGFLHMTLSGDDLIATTTLAGTASSIQHGAWPAGAVTATSETIDFTADKRAIEYVPAMPVTAGGGNTDQAYAMELSVITTGFANAAQVKLLALANGTKSVIVYYSGGTAYTGTVSAWPALIGIVMDANTSTFAVYFDGVALSLSTNTYTPAELLPIVIVYENTACPAADAGKNIGAELRLLGTSYTGTYPSGTLDAYGNAL